MTASRGPRVLTKKRNEHECVPCSRFRGDVPSVSNRHGPRCCHATSGRAQYAAQYVCLLFVQAHTHIHATGKSRDERAREGCRAARL